MAQGPSCNNSDFRLQTPERLFQIKIKIHDCVSQRGLLIQWDKNELTNDLNSTSNKSFPEVWDIHGTWTKGQTGTAPCISVLRTVLHAVNRCVHLVIVLKWINGSTYSSRFVCITVLEMKDRWNTTLAHDQGFTWMVSTSINTHTNMFPFRNATEIMKLDLVVN